MGKIEAGRAVARLLEVHEDRPAVRRHQIVSGMGVKRDERPGRAVVAAEGRAGCPQFLADLRLRLRMETGRRDVGGLGHDLGEGIGEGIDRILQRRALLRQRQSVNRRETFRHCREVAGQRQRPPVYQFDDQRAHGQPVVRRQGVVQTRRVGANGSTFKTRGLVFEIVGRREPELALFRHTG